MEDCYVQFLMNQSSRVPFYVPPHNHNCCELVYYLDGEGKTTINQIEHHYTARTFTLMPPKTVHDETASTDTHLIYIGFLYNASKYTFDAGLYPDSDGAIGSAVERMAAEWEEKKPFFSYKMNNLMQEILIAFFRRHYAAANEDSRTAQYIKQYLDEHALDSISVRSIAASTGYSYDWIRHVFKAYTGQSISQYILSRKLQRAATLLCTTKKSVEEIAAECNFPSASRFISYFKREKGITPAQFRKTAEGKENVQWSFDV